MSDLRFVDCEDLPEQADENTIYRLIPKNPDDRYYWERVDRNIGWITREEQEILQKSVVGIAGCGGMGGMLVPIFVRLGIGEVRLADPEVFDTSNINRQFAALRATVGKPKAFETARLTRSVSDDTKLVVYPQGINEKTVEDFTAGCDIVCDMIEFWAIGARILLHIIGRKQKITLLNCDTVGHRTYIFRFTHDSGKIEDALGFEYQEGKLLQENIRQGIATKEELRLVMDAVIRTFIPEVPEYFPDTVNGTSAAFDRRLYEEGKASIIPTNPPMASGFMANHVLFALLENSGTNRNFVRVPKMPGYLSFDAALMKTFRVERKWW